MEVYSIDFGLTDFGTLWEIQKKINLFMQKNPAGRTKDILIFTEHKNVYTLGRGGDRNHLLMSTEEMEKNGIDYFEIDRGGDLTYHGPGQLVCYPIFDLNNYYLDTHRYLRDLEEVIIRTLKRYGVESARDEEYTGVWVDNEKICSIGIKVSRWVTMHGLAFNVNNELGYFERIIPCGIFHKGMTSVKKRLGREADMNDMRYTVIKSFEEVFGVSVEIISKIELDKYYDTNTSH
jgi:lipoyl(octanoyl) transferase